MVSSYHQCYNFSMIQTLLIFSEWPILLLRVVLGLIFLVHGLPKIKDLKTTWQNFDMMGFKPGILWGTMVAVVEFFGGLLLISGLLTPIAAFLLAIEMAVATAWKIRRGQKLAGGFELDLLLVVSLLAIATLGGGIYSLDSYWRIILF